MLLIPVAFFGFFFFKHLKKEILPEFPTIIFKIAEKDNGKEAALVCGALTLELSETFTIKIKNI